MDSKLRQEQQHQADGAGASEPGPKGQEEDEEALRLSLKETKPPEISTTGNPNPRNPNPRAFPMSKQKRLRDMRKGREAMIRRIDKTNDGKAPLPGFILHRNDTLQARLDKLSAGEEGGPTWMLSETGEPLWDILLEKQQQIANAERTSTKRKDGQRKTTTLILGNQLGYSADDEKLLLARTPMRVRQVSLGPLSLLTSQCMTITHHFLDLLSIDAQRNKSV
jgi:tRNA pseudouridine-54 N-methylase